MSSSSSSSNMGMLSSEDVDKRSSPSWASRLTRKASERVNPLNPLLMDLDNPGLTSCLPPPVVVAFACRSPDEDELVNPADVMAEKDERPGRRKLAMASGGGWARSLFGLKNQIVGFFFLIFILSGKEGWIMPDNVDIYIWELEEESKENIIFSIFYFLLYVFFLPWAEMFNLDLVAFCLAHEFLIGPFKPSGRMWR